MTEAPTRRAAIVVRSHTGTTERYAKAIAAHLASLDVEAVATSVGNADMAALAAADFVFLGCWTNGWFVVHQHPDAPWVAFARDLPDLAGKPVALFTTYALATGSMFAAMRRELGRARADVRLELRSRGGALSDADRAAIGAFVAARQETGAA